MQHTLLANLALVSVLAVIVFNVSIRTLFSTSKQAKGFTLIEIVLVLAIAGLILVTVFLAVSGAQKSRRDAQRKNDVARVVAALITYAGNNSGREPINAAELAKFYTDYMPQIQDPLTGNYSLQFKAAGSSYSAVPPVGTMYYQQATWCSVAGTGTPLTGDGTSMTKFAVWAGLEPVGAIGCVNN